VGGDEELPVNGLEPTSGINGNGKHGEVEGDETVTIPKSLKSIIQSVRWEAERNAITVALEKTGWNRKAAARLLGVSYRSILYKIDQYQMTAPEPYISSVPGTRLSVPSQARGNGKAS
jgi:DNA-binding NtrC family response regulator